MRIELNVIMNICCGVDGVWSLSPWQNVVFYHTFEFSNPSLRAINSGSEKINKGLVRGLKTKRTPALLLSGVSSRTARGQPYLLSLALSLAKIAESATATKRRRSHINSYEVNISETLFVGAIIERQFVRNSLACEWCVLLWNSLIARLYEVHVQGDLL